MEFPRDGHDSAWNWIYFGYSLKEQRAFAYVYFGAQQSSRVLNWVDI